MMECLILFKNLNLRINVSAQFLPSETFLTIFFLLFNFSFFRNYNKTGVDEKLTTTFFEQARKT